MLARRGYLCGFVGVIYGGLALGFRGWGSRVKLLRHPEVAKSRKIWVLARFWTGGYMAAMTTWRLVGNEGMVPYTCSQELK